VFPTSHASHCPSHAASQQTPSTQNPDPQSDAVVHEAPAGFAQPPRAPATSQRAGAVQPGVAQHAPSTQ
jgi:hypothetical protein